MGDKLADAAAKLLKNKYFLLALAAGLVLLLLPIGRQSEKTTAETQAQELTERFSVETQEQRLGEALSGIDGAGRVTVLLSVSGGVERTLAADEDGTVVVSTGSGTEEAVELRWSYPEYTGAVVVCGGGNRASVRLAVTEAVRAFTGLSSNDITVLKGN